MGDGWDSAYSGVINAMDFAAIRPILLHDHNPTFRDNRLPLICIGDSLHVVPPWTGKGGNLAMHDALDVAEFLRDRSGDGKTVDVDALRLLERRCMQRAATQT